MRIKENYIIELDKRQRKIRNMFSRISKRYDILNRLMSFGLDLIWRRYLIRMADLPHNGRVLDSGAGTGDIALEIIKHNPMIRVTGIDLTYEMMSFGKKRKGGEAINWCQSYAENLPFPDSMFDAVTSGFLARNVPNVETMFKEQVRVLKPECRLVCLDTSPIPNNFLKPLILVYYKFIIPLMGLLIAGEKNAYRYLPETTMGFLKPEILAETLRASGLKDVKYRSFMLGNIAVHWGTKP